jgi:hypothetical protein
MPSKLLLTLRSAFVCMLSLLATASLAQTTIHVGPGQTYTTIQSGIDAANTGDTVLVAPGTYNENINFNGKAINVISSGGEASTIIDGGQKAPAVIFDTSETRASVLSGFTIQHGGVFNNLVPVNGGLYLKNASPSILNNILTQNNCSAIYSLNSAPLIQGNEISATQDSNDRCVSAGDGSGILISGNFYGNSTTGEGTPAIIRGNLIENNVESGFEDGGGTGGAGIAVWGGSPVILENVIRNNASPGGNGGAINLGSAQGIAIIQNLIYENSAACGGGALGIDTMYIEPRTGISALIANNTIVDNVKSQPSPYEDCETSSQIYLAPYAVYGNNVHAMLFINNIISGSTSYPAMSCDEAFTPSEANQPTFENNILYNAGGTFFGSYCVDISGEYNNLVSDPQLVNPSGDFHLKVASPAIDSGQNSVVQTFKSLTGMDLTVDSGGNPRIQDATGKGCIIDIGAYEYTGSVTDCGGVTEILTSSLNPATAGQSVTFTAQLTAESGTPTGAIQFLDGATPLSTQTVSGAGLAAFSTNSLAIGSHTITANYQPTGSFGANTASLTQVIKGYTTSASLTCLPNPIDIGNTARLTATVTSANGTPTGSISFTDNGASLATQSLTGGIASLTYTGSIAGTHNIIATYAPTGSFSASSASCSEVVNTLPTTSVLTVTPATSTYGSSITLTAAVFPATPPGPSTPTGVVTFFNGASAIGTGTLAGGVANLALSSLPGGNDLLTCIYSGSSIYATSNCNTVPVIVHAAPTALILNSSKNPAPALSPITLTARLTANGKSAGAGNAIRLSISGQTITLTTDATGSAAYTIGTLIPNSYSVTASFAATNNLLASSTALTEIVTIVPTSISLTGTPNPGYLGQPVRIAAAISAQTNSTPLGGSVTFYDGATSLGSAQATVSGSASVSTSFSVVGVHDITAVYAGDSSFSGSSSAVFKETILAGDFSISVLPGAASLYTGQSAAVKVSVASLQGFQEPLALTCSGLPANATCSFSPASLTDGQGAANLVIQTAAPHKASSGSISASAAALGALTLLLLPGWRRRRGLLAGLSVMLLAVGVFMGVVGCGSPNPITGGTPPGTYQVAVTAATMGAGTALEHSAVVTLTVKSLF